MIAAAQCAQLGAHVHLEVLEKVSVLVGAERHEHADGARESRVDERIAAARHKCGLLQRGDRLAQVKATQRLDLLRRAIQQATIPQAFVARRIDVHVVGATGWQSQLQISFYKHNEQMKTHSLTNKKALLVSSERVDDTYDDKIAELVGNGARVVVEYGEAGDEARQRVVGEYDDLVVLGLVAHEEAALLRVAHEYARAHGGDLHNRVAQLLVLALAQQLLLAHVVDAQQVADGDEHAALEGVYGHWHVLDGRAMQQLEALAAVHHLIGVDGAGRARARIEHELFGHADEQVELAVSARREARQAYAERRLVLLELEDALLLLVDRIHDAHARGPHALGRLGRAKRRLGQLGLDEGVGELDGELLLVRVGVGDHLVGHLLLALLRGRLRVAEMVRLDEVEQTVLVADGELARRVLERLDFLIEDGAELLERQDAQRVHRYGHDALRTLLGREAARVLQRLVREWRQMKATLIHVAQPAAARQCQHCLGSLCV